jgi:hypothetical protein
VTKLEVASEAEPDPTPRSFKLVCGLGLVPPNAELRIFGEIFPIRISKDGEIAVPPQLHELLLKHTLKV